MAALADAADNDWNPEAARFEIDAYFIFLLSRSLLGHKHNRQVWEDMCRFCDAGMNHVHEALVVDHDFSDVIAARVEEYGEIVNLCTESGDSGTIDRIKWLRQHLMASAHDGRIQKRHPVIIGDAFEEFSLLMEYLRVDLFFAGAFTCGMKHILQRTDDLRTLSVEELAGLARAGQKEVAAIATRTLESIAQKHNVKAKRWWQVWR